MNAKRKKRPILVVDDEPDMLRSLQGLLRLEFDVHVATSGAESMKILREHPVQVVMTDQQMPQMTGVEFLSQAKSFDPEIVRVMFSGFAETAALVDAINQGSVFRYVAKPWDPTKLAAILREAAEQHDRQCERSRLLAELQEHEEKFLEFADELKNDFSTWPADRKMRFEQLSQSAKSLRDRSAALQESTQSH